MVAGRFNARFRSSQQCRRRGATVEGDGLDCRTRRAGIHDAAAGPILFVATRRNVVHAIHFRGLKPTATIDRRSATDSLPLRVHTENRIASLSRPDQLHLAGIVRPAVFLRELHGGE